MKSEIRSVQNLEAIELGRLAPAGRLPRLPHAELVGTEANVKKSSVFNQKSKLAAIIKSLKDK